MGLLSTLLHEASARRPAEVVIETDRPVRMRLADGTSAELAAAVQGTAISDELSDLLTTEQQVDLALGEPVKFDLVVGLYTWHLVGETAQEVVSVRACPTGELLEASDSVQIPIEPDDVDLESEPEDIPRIRRAPSSGPSEIDIDINFDDSFEDEAASPTTQAPDDRPPAGLRLAALKPVPGDSKPQPVWPRRVARGTPERGARSPGARTAATARAPDTATNWPRDGRRGRTPPASTQGTQGTQGPQTTNTRQLPLRPAPRREDMAELLAAFEPGSLALLLRAPGQAEALAAALELPSLTLGESDTPAQASARLGELGHHGQHGHHGHHGHGNGGVLIVRAEDPSPWLAWLLRRVEEGRRVIVETDALTPAGARRILLGVGATPRAELWLDAVRVLSATVSEDRWILLSPGN
ncbi:MAG TPA: hypothetical protein VGB85_20000, partial [Nannocystis sp.]